MKRRALLAGCVLSAVAGCLGGTAEEGTDDDVTGHVGPEDEPDEVPPELGCDDSEFDRLSSPDDEDDLEYGDVDGFALWVSDRSYEYGDEAQFTLTNTSSEDRYTANRGHWYFQCYTEDGWSDVRGTTDGTGLDHTLDESHHGPEDGFEWNIELTEDGIVEESIDSNRVSVCPELHAGRYRFVYWGLEATSVAVQFDLDR